MLYKLYWIPIKNQVIIGEKKKFIGTYKGKTTVIMAGRDYKETSTYKHKKGAFFYNKEGSNKFTMVI
jgi:hypothetical protein